MIDAIYVTNAAHSLVYEYSSKLSVPPFQSLLPKIKTSHLETTSSKTLQNQTFKVALNSSYVLVVHKYLSLNLILLCSNDIESNPAIPYTFISRFLETLEDYFGELNGSKIETHNDMVTLLLYQMLDDGSPHITDFNKIRDLVSHNSLLTKILNEAQRQTGFNQSEAKQSFSNDVPWRREDVKYTNNEIYVDIVEKISLLVKPIVKRNNKLEQFDSAFYSSKSDKSSENYVLNGHVDGKIDLVCRLTGAPTLELVLNKVGSNMQLPTLHRCINHDLLKERRGVLSFIPPDGKSTLMEYQVDLNTFKSNREKTNLIKSSSIDVQFITNEFSSEFEIRLFPAQSINKVDYIKVHIVCADGEDQIKVNRITHGDFQTKISGSHEWSMQDVKKGVTPILSGVVMQAGSKRDERDERDEQDSNGQTQSSYKSPPQHLKLEFSYKGQVPSGLKIESLKVVNARGMAPNVKPYKGVKYITNSGSYIIRS
ncbi:uncharacterized protein LODBEIA_P43290 [Lodderomyces beijingensis]|uniref:MHD domain-containing protein n=1 Tax=Lodderomyces beijingensis TaxID=1775926 RepID=A0ABP0ZPN0_9ASCO